jgi:hypothetical protein
VCRFYVSACIYYYLIHNTSPTPIISHPSSRTIPILPFLSFHSILVGTWIRLFISCSSGVLTPHVLSEWMVEVCAGDKYRCICVSCWCDVRCLEYLKCIGLFVFGFEHLKVVDVRCYYILYLTHIHILLCTIIIYYYTYTYLYYTLLLFLLFLSISPSNQSFSSSVPISHPHLIHSPSYSFNTCRCLTGHTYISSMFRFCSSHLSISFISFYKRNTHLKVQDTSVSKLRNPISISQSSHPFNNPTLIKSHTSTFNPLFSPHSFNTCRWFDILIYISIILFQN